MKYPKLTSLVPAGEHFDESAMNTEGIWLSTKHVDSIENSLSANASAAEALSTANDTIQSLNSKVTDLETAAATSTKDISTRDARIQELEGQVAELGKKSSGTPAGTTVVTNKDEVITDQKPVPSYLDENNPANKFADKRIKRS